MHSKLASNPLTLDATHNDPGQSSQAASSTGDAIVLVVKRCYWVIRRLATPFFFLFSLLVLVVCVWLAS